MKKKGPFQGKNPQKDPKSCSCQERVFDEFLEDVEKDMKRERYQKIWEKYGKLISITTTALLSGVLVFIFWQRYDQEQREDAASQFIQAQTLQRDGKADEAREILKMLSLKSPHNYTVLAELSQAAALTEQGFDQNIDQIIAIYKSVLYKKAPHYYKQFAAVQYINASLQKLGEGAMTEEQKNEWLKYLRWYKGQEGFGLRAQELEALILFKCGDLEAARPLLNDLSKNPKTPSSMQFRVGVLIQAIQDSRSHNTQ